jgi:pyocin large subunit-like protein
MNSKNIFTNFSFFNLEAEKKCYSNTRIITIEDDYFNSAGFASENELNYHFQKHSSEFGFLTETEYLARAKDFIKTQGNNDVLVKVRPNGDHVLYNPKTNEFAVTQFDGTIRTYFKPSPTRHHEPTNLDYFYRQ